MAGKKKLDSKAKLNRDTDLAVALDILTHKHIALISPTKWEDLNDSHSLTQYQNKNGFTGFLALCFAKNSETFHQWRVFSGGSSGICIEFDKAKLLNKIQNEGSSRIPVGENAPVTHLNRLLF